MDLLVSSNFPPRITIGFIYFFFFSYSLVCVSHNKVERFIKEFFPPNLYIFVGNFLYVIFGSVG